MNAARSVASRHAASEAGKSHIPLSIIFISSFGERRLRTQRACQGHIGLPETVIINEYYTSLIRMSLGKSLALSQGTFLQPPSEDEADVQELREPSLERQKRHANLYDAIAGLCITFIF